MACIQKNVLRNRSNSKNVDTTFLPKKNVHDENPYDPFMKHMSLQGHKKKKKRG